MKCYAVDDGDQKEGPVGSAFGFGDVAAVINREEDVRCLGEVGEGVFEGEGVEGLGEEEGHAGAEEHDFGGLVVDEVLALEVSGFVSRIT